MDGKIEIERTARREELKHEIDSVKRLLSNLSDNHMRTGRGNPNMKNISKGTQWKKGQSGCPQGPPKSRVQFWRYICRFLDMLKAEVEGLDEDTLTLAQLGARKFSLAVAEGKWMHMKEVIDRELGRTKEGQGQEDSDVPKLIRLPFRIVNQQEISEVSEVPDETANSDVANSN